MKMKMIVLSMLAFLVQSGLAGAEWRRPLDPLAPESAISIEAIRPGVDPCGCLRELRACLVAATHHLGRCLSWAHDPKSQALCYLRFELEVLLCLDRASACEQSC